MDIPKLEFKDFVIKKASSDKSIYELLKSIGSINKNAVVQIFDADSIANNIHLIGAYANALIAFKNHTNKTKTIGMEMLLFAAMTDQIETAIKIAGVKSSSNFILFSDKRESINKLKRSLKRSSDFRPTPIHVKTVARHFGIKTDELDRINEQLLNKMAMSRLASD